MRHADFHLKLASDTTRRTPGAIEENLSGIRKRSPLFYGEF
jgi:hypothetical protein